MRVLRCTNLQFKESQQQSSQEDSFSTDVVWCCRPAVRLRHQTSTDGKEEVTDASGSSNEELQIQIITDAFI